MLTDAVSINAHSSIRIAGEKVLWFDPFHLTEEPHDADLVLITHDHYDHLSPEDIARVRKEGTGFVLPASCRGSAEKNGLENCVYLTPGERAEVKGIPVEAVAEQLMGKASSLMVSWYGNALVLATVMEHIPDLSILPVTARSREEDGILYIDLHAEAKRGGELV